MAVAVRHAQFCYFRAYPVQEYPAKCSQAAAVMHMIMNNLDDRVAQFPDELVTYGGNGQVFSNWAQVLLIKSVVRESNLMKINFVKI